MENPFLILEKRLLAIEELLYDLKTLSQKPIIKQEPEIVDADEACKITNLAKSTLYKKVSDGSLSYIKKGKKLYFISSKLKDWIKEGEKQSKDEIEKKAFEFLSNQKKDKLSYNK
jgi:excisionase family DNA binding protein